MLGGVTYRTAASAPPRPRTRLPRITAWHPLLGSLLKCYLPSKAFPYHLLFPISALWFSTLSNQQVRVCTYAHVYTRTRVHVLGRIRMCTCAHVYIRMRPEREKVNVARRQHQKLTHLGDSISLSADLKIPRVKS